MTLLAVDDFDRSGALGANWQEAQGSFLLDGDRCSCVTPPAASPGALGIAYFIALGTAAESTAIGLYRKTSAKFTKGDPGNGISGSAEFGIIPRVGAATGGGSPVEQFEWIHTSVGGGAMVLRRRAFGTPLLFTDFTTPFAWATDESHVLSAIWSVGVFGGVVDIRCFVDGVQMVAIGSPSTSGISLKYKGIFTNRVIAVAGNPNAAATPIDLFHVEDAVAAANVEPTLATAADTVLSGLNLELTLAAGTPFPIGPSSVIPEERGFATNSSRMVSAHVVRHPRLSGKQCRWTFDWIGLSQSDLASLVAWFAAAQGSVKLATYTTPESVVMKFAMDRPLDSERVGINAHHARTTGVECTNDQ